MSEQLTGGRSTCDAVSPTFTPCQRDADHDGVHRGRTAGGDVAQWPDDAISSSDVQRFVGEGDDD